MLTEKEFTRKPFLRPSLLFYRSDNMDIGLSYNASALFVRLTDKAKKGWQEEFEAFMKDFDDEQPDYFRVWVLNDPDAKEAPVQKYENINSDVIYWTKSMEGNLKPYGWAGLIENDLTRIDIAPILISAEAITHEGFNGMRDCRGMSAEEMKAGISKAPAHLPLLAAGTKGRANYADWLIFRDPARPGLIVHFPPYIDPEKAAAAREAVSDAVEKMELSDQEITMILPFEDAEWAYYVMPVKDGRIIWRRNHPVRSKNEPARCLMLDDYNAAGSWFSRRTAEGDGREWDNLTGDDLWDKEFYEHE